MTKEAEKKIRRAGGVMFLIYLTALIYFLFFAEGLGRAGGMEEYRYNLIPFREIRRYILYHDMLDSFTVTSNLIGNVVGFLPFGAILPVLWRRARNVWMTLLPGLLFSAAVELTQLFFRVGCFDVDDIILNTLGAGIGFCLFQIGNHLRRKLYV